MTEGTIVRWLKRVGESVAKDEPLLTVETDKAATDVLSPAAGTLLEIAAAEGERVPVGRTIARIGAPNADAPSGSAASGSDARRSRAPSAATSTPAATSDAAGSQCTPTSPASEPAPVEPAGQPGDASAPVAPADQPLAATAPVAPTAQPRDASAPVAPTTQPRDTSAPVAPTIQSPETSAPVASTGRPLAPSAPVAPASRAQAATPASGPIRAASKSQPRAIGQPADPAPFAGGDRERLLWLHRAMLRIRLFDERIVALFNAGRLAGALHSYVGEEAVAAGVCVNLRPDDCLSSTHRGHGHLLAKGGSMHRMMAELFGRVDGYCRGKGGSMHIVDMSLGILGANGIVGAGIPIATGAATAIALRGGDQVVACFFGDGASNIGTFHEGVNLAATWRLPVIFVCENNGYAQFTAQSMHAAVSDLFSRASGYGIPGVSVDGNDATAVAEVAAEAIARARAGGGPTLIEAKTYRWFGHAINNPASSIGRPEAEIAAWKARDPIPFLEASLRRHGFADDAEIAAARAAAAGELDAAIAFAEASPVPEPAEALDHVYTLLPPGAEL
jgi:pyruvate dehydrogenase E1 component alpha subunit